MSLLFQSRYRGRKRFSPLSHFICLLYSSNFSYIWEKIKKILISYYSLSSFFCWWQSFLYPEKLSRRYHLRISTLPKYHALNFLLDFQHIKETKLYCFSMEHLTDKQHSKLKSSIIDITDHFSFHTVYWKDKNTVNSQISKLNEILDNSSSSPNTVMVIADASIKNRISTSILHIYNCHNIIKKTIYHVINITLIKWNYLLLDTESIKLCKFLTLTTL